MLREVIAAAVVMPSGCCAMRGSSVAGRYVGV